MTRRFISVLLLLCIGVCVVYYSFTRLNLNPKHHIGDVIDEMNHVAVYYNGAIQHTSGRNLSADSYNIGLKYQCVEFVKRYYYQRFSHKMPDSMGHAKDFFDGSIADGDLNTKRMLVQYKNGGATMPAVEDLIVFAPWFFNAYGHVAIISRVDAHSIEVIQQNAGLFGSSREVFSLAHRNGGWFVDSNRALGWLRRPEPTPLSQQ